MPDAWKKMTGNPGRRPIEGADAVMAAGVPPCPSHLDFVARQEWARIAPLLLAAGLLCTVDSAALAMYCVAYSRWEKAERQIEFHSRADTEGQGLVTSSKNGFDQLSQWYIISRAEQDRLHKMLTEFGLSPSARARVKAASAQVDLFGNDPLAAFQAAAPRTA